MCRPGACRGGAGGGAWRAAAGLGYGRPAGRGLRGGGCSHWMPASAQRWSGPLPRRRARASGARAVGANGLGARVLGARPAGTGGLEARAARTAIPRPGRAEDSGAASASAGRTRIRSARGWARAPGWRSARRHRSATGWQWAEGWRARPGLERGALVRRKLRPWSSGRGRGRRGRVVEGCVVEGCVKRCVVEGGRGEPLAGQVTLGVPGGRALRLGALRLGALRLGALRLGALRLSSRRRLGARRNQPCGGLRRRARNRRQRLALRQPAQDRARIAGHQLPAGAGPELSGPAARTRGA